MVRGLYMGAPEILTKLIAYHIVINPWGNIQFLLLFFVFLRGDQDIYCMYQWPKAVVV